MLSFDVVIVGGGPAGSTVGSLLKRYRPDLEVAIFESARFPRDHVGESLLPTACSIIDEAGAWVKIERLGFPIKLGAFYRWGTTPDLVQFHFLNEEFRPSQRPALYDGQRLATTWQVDRSVFDQVLLEHAESLGCQVFQETPVQSVQTSGNQVTGLSTSVGEVRARYYVDASGSRAIFRKAFNVATESPTNLRNIAVWDYWQGAEWLDRTGDGTYIRILSLDWGWLWFITIGESRTSVGLVTAAEYYKKSGLSIEALYQKALSEEPNIGKLLRDAVRENRLEADKDWSYISARLIGDNWFLAGDTCGFADPILSAGITLAMTGSRKVAYSICALEEGELDPDWVRSEYDRTHRANIKSHIRFADYWYKVNQQFGDLEEYCSEIAKDSGLDLEPKAAFRWIGTGGFTDDYSDQPTVGTYTLTNVKSLMGQFSGIRPEWQIMSLDRLKLNLEGAEKIQAAVYREGKIKVKETYVRGDQRLLMDAFYRRAFVALSAESEPGKVVDMMTKWIVTRLPDHNHQQAVVIAMETMEAMFIQGWIVAG